MTSSISSNSLGLENPLRPLGWIKLLAAGCVCIVSVVSGVVAVAQTADGSARTMELARCGLGLLFALSLLASGLRAILAFIPQGEVPGSLRQGAVGVRALLEKKLITGTYDPPTSLIALMIYQLTPRFAFLTLPHRQALQGVGFRLLLLTAALIGVCFFSWVAVWLATFVVIELAARWTAVIMARPEQPATMGVRELHDHLGDKGDPVGLFHHLRNACERYRVGAFPNRCLAESAPHVAEHVQDARIESEYFVETQPSPIKTLQHDGIVLGAAAALLAVLGCGLLLLTPLSGGVTAATNAVIGSGIFGLVASVTCFRLSYVCLAGMRFQSDVFLIRMRGTYNTTRVGSQFQRTSFQSDIYLDVLSARIVSELASGGSQRATGSQIADFLQSSRVIVTVLDEELLSFRLNELVHAARTYQDQASSARPTDFSSPDYAQHLMRIQAESFVAAQAMAHAKAVAQSLANLPPQTNTSMLPQMLPALPVPSVNVAARPATPAAVAKTFQTGQPAISSSAPIGPLSNPPPRVVTQRPVPKKAVLPPPPPRKKP